jgi:hypothetical protein
MRDWMIGCPGLPSDFKVPDGYVVRRDGVWTTEDDKPKAPVTGGPVVPVAVFMDPDGTQLVQLVWLDRGDKGDVWVTRTVPRGVVKSGRRLVTALGDVGLPVTEADARGVERWLARVEAHNRLCIPRRRLARWLGWQGDGTFVAGQDAPDRVEPAWPEQAGALAAHHPRGTLEGWQSTVSKLKGYPAAVAVLSTAFAASLLDVLGLDSFTIDISGRSTRGKTTAAKVALSAWADPSERSEALFSWRTTLLAVEKRLNLVRGIPVVLDETRVVKVPELVDQVLYQVPKNHGQARGGGWPSMLPWHTIVVSTGEQSALSFTTHQGAGARVLTLSRPPFPAGAETVAEDAAAVGAGICDDYGTAGPAFVAQLRKAFDQADGKSRIRARHAELTEAHRGATDLSGRRAPMLAALVLAAELAHAWGIVPLAPPSPGEWADLFRSVENSDDRPGMALDVVREWVASSGAALWTSNRYGTQPATGWIGRHIEHDDKATVALLPQKLREALQRAGYSLDAVLPGWQESGVLVRSGAKQAPWTPVSRLGDSKPRMYVFTPGQIEIDPDRPAEDQS